MKQEGKLKALKKVIDMLVVPKINDLSDITGVKIRSVKVVLTSYGERNDESDFQVYVDLTREPNFNRACEGMAHLILNVAEYIDPNCELVIYFSEWGSDIEFHSLYAGGRVFRRSTDECIYMITGGHGQ
jgi:hypothetical protein